MWTFVVAALAQVPPAGSSEAGPAAREPRFGAFVEQFDDRPSTGFVTYDREGRWWVHPTLASLDEDGAGDAPLAGGRLGREILRGGEQGLAFAADGSFFVTRTRSEALVWHPRGDRGESGLGTADSSRHEGVVLGRRGPGDGEFLEPRGTCVVEPAGSDARLVFVADAWKHRIVVLASRTAPLPESAVLARSFGSYGAGDGELNHPNDVAVDARGHAWVADLGNDRVVEFDENGRFVRAVGGRGVEPGLFVSPTGLDVHGERVYVADRDNHRVQVFDLEGRFVHEFGEPAVRPREGHGKLHAPTDVAISPDGTRAAIVEEVEDRVQVFGLVTGEPPATIPVRDASAHYGGRCSARGELFAVAEPAFGSVSVFDVSSGTAIEITKFGRPGTGPGRLARPAAVLFDARAEVLYVADPFAYRVHAFAIARAPDEPLRFDPHRARLVASLDLRACPPLRATFPTEPVDLELGPGGEVHVLDAANERVVVLDAALRPVRTSALGSAPRAFAWDSGADAWTFVAAPHLATALQGGFELTDLARTSRGAFWAVDRGRHALVSRRAGVEAGPAGREHVGWEHVVGRVVPRAAGEPARRPVSRAGLGRGEFAHPESLACDGNGRVYVVDAGNHRVQVFDEDGAYLDMFGARLFTEAGRTPPLARPARAWDGANSVRTNDGAFRVRWKLRAVAAADGVPSTGSDSSGAAAAGTAPARFERGTPAALDAWVFAVGRPDAPVAVEGLGLDAWMPDHQHGLNARPRVARRDDGGFSVEGLRLFMSGAWEVDFDVLSGGVTSRAQVRVELE